MPTTELPDTTATGQYTPGPYDPELKEAGQLTSPTWELELFLSGAFVFATFQLPGVIESVYQRLEPHVNRHSGHGAVHSGALLRERRSRSCAHRHLHDPPHRARAMGGAARGAVRLPEGHSLGRDEGWSNREGRLSRQDPRSRWRHREARQLLQRRVFGWPAARHRVRVLDAARRDGVRRVVWSVARGQSRPRNADILLGGDGTVRPAIPVSAAIIDKRLGERIFSGLAAKLSACCERC